MRKKNVLVVILTVLIFLSATILGVSAVFRVDEVLVVAPVVSEEAKTEATELKRELLKAYEKESIFSVEESVAKNVIAKFPYFHMTKFEKAYPNRLVVTVREGEEVYATPCDETAGTYYILDEAGTVLGIRESTANRADGANNVLIVGQPALMLTGEKWQPLAGDEALETLFAFCKAVSKDLNGIRRNVISVTVLRLASAKEETLFKLEMREGVNVYVRNPADGGAAKAKIAIDKYLSLSDGERLKGAILVFDNEGEVVCNYYERDEIGQ
ncbi:MAG: hypothetical protein IJX88_04035 [Clostridia bacterium]|nr:hypothetical protein [Clostridia bacterium]